MAPKLTEQQVSKIRTLIAYMDGLKDPRFTMREVFHDCGAPACAWGHARSHFGDEWAAQMAGSKYAAMSCMEEELKNAFFAAPLSNHIHTPQQWADHARQKLAEWGYEQPGAQTPEPVMTGMDSPTSFTTSADPAPFRAFMAKTLEPVEV